MLKKTKSWSLYLAVGLGGAIGSLCRYSISVLFFPLSTSVFPWATFIANLCGAFILAYLLFQPVVKKALQPMIFTGLTTGVIGSFTTFSTIMVELGLLIKQDLTIAILYLLATMIAGLLASYMGYLLARRKERNVHAHR